MSHEHNGETHINEVEASGGTKEGVVRWVLLIGLVLAIGLLTIIWMTGAMTQGDVEEEATVSGQIQSLENDGDATDSIVSDDVETVGEAATDDAAQAAAADNELAADNGATED